MDACFASEAGVLTERAAAIILNQEKVLLCMGKGDDFWVLPGGRVGLFESAKKALIRELAEETGLAFGPGRLAWVVESFFTYRGTRYHEVAFYFVVEPVSDATRQADRTIVRPDSPEGGPNLTLKWHPVDALPEVKPAFLSSALRSVPATPHHLVLVDGQIVNP